MEDHLKCKDRLAREWEALCAYEADPCATTAASLPANVKKNRHPDVLPCECALALLMTPGPWQWKRDAGNIKTGSILLRPLLWLYSGREVLYMHRPPFLTTRMRGSRDEGAHLMCRGLQTRGQTREVGNRRPRCFWPSKQFRPSHCSGAVRDPQAARAISEALAYGIPELPIASQEEAADWRGDIGTEAVTCWVGLRLTCQREITEVKEQRLVRYRKTRGHLMLCYPLEGSSQFNRWVMVFTRDKQCYRISTQSVARRRKNIVPFLFFDFFYAVLLPGFSYLNTDWLHVPHARKYVVRACKKKSK